MHNRYIKRARGPNSLRLLTPQLARHPFIEAAEVGTARHAYAAGPGRGGHRRARRAQDANLRHTLQFGIGLHHAGLGEADRSLVEHLFVGGKVQARPQAGGAGAGYGPVAAPQPCAETCMRRWR